MDMHEEIEKAAYELYEKSGRACGRDLENWLEAENAVKARLSGKKLAASTAKVAVIAAEKVKKAVKETLSGAKSAPKKRI